MSTSKQTIYFGYGSNLWLHQMSLRCPDAKYIGIARLNGYKWLINDRGYANVVELNTTSTSTGATDAAATHDDVVYGMVYTLTSDDEDKLDKNEGVPIAYTKEMLECDFWSAGEASKPMDRHRKVDVEDPPTKSHDMLVYIDRQRTTPDVPRKEYIYRMNQGISDAIKLGMPQDYVDGAIRRFIPQQNGDEEIGEFARGQAARFRDESGVFR